MKLFYVLPDGICHSYKDVINSAGDESVTPELFNKIAELAEINESLKALAGCVFVWGGEGLSLDKDGVISELDDADIIEKAKNLQVMASIKPYVADCDVDVLLAGLNELSKVKAAYVGDVMKVLAPNAYQVIVKNLTTKAVVTSSVKSSEPVKHIPTDDDVKQIESNIRAALKERKFIAIPSRDSTDPKEFDITTGLKGVLSVRNQKAKHVMRKMFGSDKTLPWQKLKKYNEGDEVVRTLIEGEYIDSLIAKLK